MQDLVSIIIPVHNSSKTIEDCLNSIFEQTYKNIEIVAIENGSRDNSLEILNKYKDKIIIKSIQKLGAGVARNEGIKLAKGKYLSFVDSDDCIDEYFIEKLVKSITENDSSMSLCNMLIRTNNTTKVKGEYPNNNVNKDEVINNLDKFNYGPCNKLYKKEIIDKYDIKFDEELKYEDLPFVFKYIINSKSISKVDEALYIYNIHSESEQTIVDNRIFDILRIINKCETLVDKDKFINLKVKILTNYITKTRYIKDNKIRDSFIEEGYKELNKNNWKDCKYLKEINFIERLIYKNKIFMKIYTKIYSICH